MTQPVLPQTAQQGEMLGREFITAIVIFHEHVGKTMGLSPVERKCIDILKRLGPSTAGEIAAHTGLTTGAVTGLVDRLQKAGYAERTRDPHDRRKVVVKVTANDQMNAVLATAFGPLGADMAELMSTYTPEELNVIADFQRRTTDILVTNTRRISKR